MTVPMKIRVIASTKKHFEKTALDASYIATNAPGRSAFNGVVRRMALLNHELTDDITLLAVISNQIKHKNNDVELQQRNFSIVKIWSKLIIDEFHVVAEYIALADCSAKQLQNDDTWYMSHICELQYFPRIVNMVLKIVAVSGGSASGMY